MAEKKKKVPLGKPLRLTDEVLDVLSEVKPGDIEKAKQLWRNTVPKKYADLLDAETVDEEQEEK